MSRLLVGFFLFFSTVGSAAAMPCLAALSFPGLSEVTELSQKQEVIAGLRRAAFNGAILRGQAHRNPVQLDSWHPLDSFDERDLAGRLAGIEQDLEKGVTTAVVRAETLEEQLLLVELTRQLSEQSWPEAYAKYSRGGLTANALLKVASAVLLSVGVLSQTSVPPEALILLAVPAVSTIFALSMRPEQVEEYPSGFSRAGKSEFRSSLGQQEFSLLAKDPVQGGEWHYSSVNVHPFLLFDLFTQAENGKLVTTLVARQYAATQ
ncbi:hypothetical protein K2X33_07535 [bacterium]|nr:hypothetical protein [bacterium]